MRSAGILIALMLVTTAISSTDAVGQSTLAIYVTSDKRDSLPSDKRRELTDSAGDVREHLKKRDGVEAVDSQRGADLRVTILDRRIEVNESGRNDWGGSLSQTHYQSRYVLTYRFESAETIEESEIALAGAFVTWKRVAGVLAKDAEEWARHQGRGNR